MKKTILGLSLLILSTCLYAYDPTLNLSLSQSFKTKNGDYSQTYLRSKEVLLQDLQIVVGKVAGQDICCDPEIQKPHKVNIAKSSGFSGGVIILSMGKGSYATELEALDLSFKVIGGNLHEVIEKGKVFGSGEVLLDSKSAEIYCSPSFGELRSSFCGSDRTAWKNSVNGKVRISKIVFNRSKATVYDDKGKIYIETMIGWGVSDFTGDGNYFRDEEQ